MKGCTNQLIFQTTNPTSVPKLFHEDIILRMFEKWWEIFYEGDAVGKYGAVAPTPTDH